jgi:hypothetical protein
MTDESGQRYISVEMCIRFRRALGPTQHPIRCKLSFFAESKTTHLHPVPAIRMGGAKFIFPLYAFMSISVSVSFHLSVPHT